jgi:ABC-type oligopeptide transport system substrate-binding subunit
MRRILLSLAMLSLVAIGLTGCNSKSASTTQETKTTTPGGTTTVTVEKQVEQTGDNPPPVRP